jgi:hypothetical protein
MIKEYIEDLAAQMGVHISKISVVEGESIGCSDVLLLHLSSGCQLVNALVYQSDLEDLKKGSSCDRLEVRIRIALSRLHLLTEPEPCV